MISNKTVGLGATCILGVLLCVILGYSQTRLQLAALLFPDAYELHVIEDEQLRQVRACTNDAVALLKNPNIKFSVVKTRLHACHEEKEPA